MDNEGITILASQADWPWPQALRVIFQPRGVNLLMADDLDGFVNVLNERRVHTAIVDLDSFGSGLAVLRIIRSGYPYVPCIVLKTQPERNLLDTVLQLNAFALVEKPVDLGILQGLLHRLFVKKYHCNVFA